MSYLLEGLPGIDVHQNVFWMLSGFSLIGGIAAYRYFVRY